MVKNQQYMITNVFGTVFMLADIRHEINNTYMYIHYMYEAYLSNTEY